MTAPEAILALREAAIVNVNALTMADVAALAGLPAVRHCPKPTPHVCDFCGGDCIWAIEITGRYPEGSGYLIEVCESCDRATGQREWWGH